MPKLTLIRNLIAFWIFGLCNNFAYVIMLSAAEDILDQQQHVVHSDNDTGDTCDTDYSSRHCAPISTGAVLLADIIPSLIIKLTFPFFMQRIPFGFRHFVVVCVQSACYLIVAFSTNVPMSLAGVVFASMCSGLGEITYLGLSSYFPKSMISAWSSGTGGAGVVGAFAYAALTEPSLAGLSPKNALLSMLVVPLLFAIAYWLILSMPSTVYSPTLNPKSWIVPQLRGKSDSMGKEVMSSSWESSDRVGDSSSHSYEVNNTTASVKEESSEQEMVPQRITTFKEKLMLVVPLLKYMIPLSLVYFGEYIINQGLVQLIFFDCARGWSLSRKSQYRWYQVLYQVGVFISRSSVNVFELPFIVMLILPLLQIANAVFFLFDSIYFFVPHIGIVFALILFEGLLGGSSYVNTFNRIHREVPSDVREFSLSAASMSDSFGIVVSGFLAIPIHNAVCAHPLNARP